MTNSEGQVIRLAFGTESLYQGRLKEPEARACYLALGPGRSIRCVREHFGELSVSERSLETWSSKK